MLRGVSLECDTQITRGKMVSIEGDGQPLLRWAMMPIRCTNYSAKSCAARVQGSLARTAWRSTPSYTVSNALCRFFATVYIGTSGYLPSSILLAQRPGAHFAAFNIFLRRNFQSLSTLYLRPMPCIQHVCCLLYTSPSPRDKRQSRMPSSA